jgi:hypothetical protein
LFQSTIMPASSIETNATCAFSSTVRRRLSASASFFSYSMRSDDSTVRFALTLSFCLCSASFSEATSSRAIVTAMQAQNASRMPTSVALK